VGNSSRVRRPMKLAADYDHRAITLILSRTYSFHAAIIKSCFRYY
jgi:hypothetical protein